METLKFAKSDHSLKLLSFFQFHAAKTGHANFSESAEAIKPLTTEEKQQRLEKYDLKMRFQYKRVAQGFHTFSCHSAIVESTSHFTLHQFLTCSTQHEIQNEISKF